MMSAKRAFKLVGSATLLLVLLVSFQNCSGGFKGIDSNLASQESVPTVPVTMAPFAPTSLTATAIADTQVNLSWQDSSAGANATSSYTISRAPSTGSVAGTYAMLAVVAGGVTSYSDKTTVATTTYYYKVTGANSVGTSPDSIAAQVTTLAAPAQPPAMPTNLAATALSATSIKLTWSSTDATVTSFDVERAPGGTTTFTAITSVAAGTFTYTDMNLSASTSYTYRVRAANSAGNSTYSGTATTATQAAPVNTASFSYIYANILQNNCVGCHNPNNLQGGFDYSTYAATLKSVTPNNSAASAMYLSVANASMPVGSTLTSAQIADIKAWIDAGALNN